MTRRRKRVIVDTGPLVALIDSDDAYHDECVAWLDQAIKDRKLLVVPVPVITEVCYLLGATGGADYEAKFLEELAEASALFTMFSPSRGNLLRMAELVRRYSDMPLGTADASVVTAAEQVGTQEVASVDKRLRAVRLNGDQHLFIVP